MITRWLIRRRDAAAERWLWLSMSQPTSTAERRAQRALASWDRTLTVWSRQ